MVFAQFAEELWYVVCEFEAMFHGGSEFVPDNVFMPYGEGFLLFPW